MSILSEWFSVEPMLHGLSCLQGDIGEEFSCKVELGNHQDPFVVAVVRPAVTIDNILKMRLSVHSKI